MWKGNKQLPRFMLPPPTTKDHGIIEQFSLGRTLKIIYFQAPLPDLPLDQVKMYKRYTTTMNKRLSQKPSAAGTRNSILVILILITARWLCIPIHLLEYYEVAHFIHLAIKVGILYLYCISTEFNSERVSTTFDNSNNKN